LLVSLKPIDDIACSLNSSEIGRNFFPQRKLAIDHGTDYDFVSKAPGVAFPSCGF